MGKQLTRWHKAGRFITGLVVLCFFLPFFGVSCGPIDIVTMSGADMVGGCKPGGAIATAKEEGQSEGMGDIGVKVDKVEREPLAIIAMACVIIAFGLAWVRTKQALIATFVVALAGIGALGGLYVKVTGDLDEVVATELARKKARGAESGGSMAREAAESIDSGARMGFWAACLGLIGVAALTGASLREKDAAAPASAAPPKPA